MFYSSIPGHFTQGGRPVTQRPRTLYCVRKLPSGAKCRTSERASAPSKLSVYLAIPGRGRNKRCAFKVGALSPTLASQSEMCGRLILTLKTVPNRSPYETRGRVYALNAVAITQNAVMVTKQRPKHKYCGSVLCSFCFEVGSEHQKASASTCGRKCVGK